MRWTEENKDILWRTVFKTNSFHIDLTKVAKEWPSNDKPTPKALKEQLEKYRKNLGGDSRITFGMVGQNAAGTPTGTPRKKGLGKKGSNSAPTTPKKRETPKKEQASEGHIDPAAVKEEQADVTITDEGDGDESEDVKIPTLKRIKKEFQDDGFF